MAAQTTIKERIVADEETKKKNLAEADETKAKDEHDQAEFNAE